MNERGAHETCWKRGAKMRCSTELLVGRAFHLRLLPAHFGQVQDVQVVRGQRPLAQPAADDPDLVLGERGRVAIAAIRARAVHTLDRAPSQRFDVENVDAVMVAAAVLAGQLQSKYGSEHPGEHGGRSGKSSAESWTGIAAKHEQLGADERGSVVLDRGRVADDFHR